MKDGGVIQSVNDASVKTAPKGAIDQLGQSLDRIIHAMAQADEEDKVFMAKWDIKDGFWRLDCQDGEEWNFAYVLPQEDGKPVKLVVPTSLQMGWIESPPYFCAASETGRDVAQQYAEAPVGSLENHKFIVHALQGGLRNFPWPRGYQGPSIHDRGLHGRLHLHGNPKVEGGFAARSKCRMSSSSQQQRATPDHWPIASLSSTSTSMTAAALFHPIVVAKDTTTHSNSNHHHTATTRRSPLQFFSINRLLHQQDEECWENNSNDVVDDDSDSSSDSYYEQIMKMPQSQSSSDDEHNIHIQRPSTPSTSPPPLLTTSSKKKYVTFNSNNLISSIHYRPRTNTPDISKLYYTEIQIKQFKKEYKHDKRIEKKKLNNISNVRQIDSICLTTLDGDSEESLSSCQKFF